MPDSLDINWLGREINFVSLTDEWFEGISPPEIGQLLEIGFECGVNINGSRSLKWSLSGRPLYVLTTSNVLSGFVSTTRLVIGKEHVVLCKEELLNEVNEVILQTDSKAPQVLGSDDGLPEGWACLRNIVPRKPIRQNEGQDILNILRPLPDVEIVLDGGIRIESSIWLNPYPPMISIHGDLSKDDRVLIDGKEAIINEKGGYIASNWDQLGDHNIWVAGQNKSYTISEADGPWGFWQAHLYRGKKHNEIGICGPIVTNDNNSIKDCYPTIVPKTNPVLIGPVPGQIVNLENVFGKESSYGHFSSFQAVWALPSNPYQADKHTASILAMGNNLLPHKIPNLFSLSNSEKELIWEWSNTILAASRKGLEPDTNSPEVNTLWKIYKKQAKSIWKRLR